MGWRMVNASFALLEEWVWASSTVCVWCGRCFCRCVVRRNHAPPLVSPLLVALVRGAVPYNSSEEGKRAVLVGFPCALACLRMGRGESVYIFIS